MAEWVAVDKRAPFGAPVFCQAVWFCCRSSKRQPHTYRPRKHSSEYEAAPGWQLDARTVLWQYGRFDEDAVPWRRLERVEDKRLPVERIDEQSAWCFGSCGVGGSRIR